MTHLKQRIAIAKACGWGLNYDWERPGIGEWWEKTGEQPRRSNDLPDYLNDLNAMHEARSALTPNRQEYFVCVLDRMLHGGRASDLSEQFLSLHATAAQRAEAFLRTLGKWEESA